MTPTKLITLADLLKQGKTPGTLATAIEQVGIWGWDSFGRCKHFKLKTPEAEEALRLLEAEANHWPDPQDESPLEESERMGDLKYRQHGWKPDDVPDFAGIHRLQPTVQRPASLEKSHQANLALIGALLAVIKGDAPFMKHPEYESEAKLIVALTTTYQGFPGMSKRTIEDKFRDAKELLQSF